MAYCFILYIGGTITVLFGHIMAGSDLLGLIYAKTISLSSLTILNFIIYYTRLIKSAYTIIGKVIVYNKMIGEIEELHRDEVDFMLL